MPAGLHGERQQQEAEGDRGRPRRPIERGREALDDAEQHRRDQGAGQAAHAAEHADGEHAADILAPHRRLDRLDDDEASARQRRSADGNAEGDALDADRVDRQQSQRQLVLRHGHDGAAHEGSRQVELQGDDEQHGDHARHQHAQREIGKADAPGRPDIRRLHVAVVDAEHQDQRHLGDEQQAEEEGETAQRLLPAPLEGDVVDLIDRRTQQIERRQREQWRRGSDRGRRWC